jgi:hypothetical protein
MVYCLQDIPRQQDILGILWEIKSEVRVTVNKERETMTVLCWYFLMTNVKLKGR